MGKGIPFENNSPIKFPNPPKSNLVELAIVAISSCVTAMLRPRNPLHIHRTTLHDPAQWDQVLTRRIPYMQGKVQNREKGNERVEAKGSIGGVDFPRVDESRV